ncbi:cupin domain-containing protein [Oerskovia flava]|uniref:cupin domain-containing protein n=1 Tax=Oerskovia flava TaxID=2986422 RepID=UPI0022402AEB|nr:cupin domain-containing protein [Oerskovia sp. JB1-3-2]
MSSAGTRAPDAPVFPGGTSVSHLRVYDWPTDDAPGGSGTPHLHTASAEGYVVLAGRGSVETLGPEGFAVHGLEPGRVVWFTPGVIHRLVNDGGLELVVVMSNAGLPEAGDAVLTFPVDVVRDADRYAAAAALPSPEGADDAGLAAAAHARRDLALAGYARLRAAVEQSGPGALAPLYDAAARLVAPRVAGWRRTWESSVVRATHETDAVLAALAVGDGSALTAGRVAARAADPGPRSYGMCGRLATFPIAPTG